MEPQTEEQVAIAEAGADSVTRTMQREITLDLSKEDIAALGSEAAEAEKQVTLLEIEFDGVKKEYGVKIKKIEAQMRTLLEKIRGGTRTEVVECKEVRNYHEGKVSYFMGEKLVEERTMDADELQQDLLLREKKDTQQLNLDEPQPTDIRDVIQEETRKSTKHSSVDGPVA